MTHKSNMKKVDAVCKEMKQLLRKAKKGEASEAELKELGRLSQELTALREALSADYDRLVKGTTSA